MVALGQTYFAIQTRKQELSEKEYNELTEDEKRLYRRNQARKGNYNLNNSKIYRTDEDGSIMFKIKNNKLKIETCSSQKGR